jgi:hypothetical protein
MNVTALLTGVGGAAYGALIFWVVALQGRRWAGCGMLAIGTSLLLDIATTGNRSRAEHNTVWLIQCALVALFAVCAVLDNRAKRRLGRLTANSGS